MAAFCKTQLLVVFKVQFALMHTIRSKTSGRYPAYPVGEASNAEAALVLRKPIREAVDLTNGNARLVGFFFFFYVATRLKDLRA